MYLQQNKFYYSTPVHIYMHVLVTHTFSLSCSIMDICCDLPISKALMSDPDRTSSHPPRCCFISHNDAFLYEMIWVLCNSVNYLNKDCTRFLFTTLLFNESVVMTKIHNCIYKLTRLLLEVPIRH